MIEKFNLGDSIDIGGKNINGEWIKSNNRLWSGNITANFTSTFSLANILPNDGYDYEVHICDWINTDSTSGHEVKIFIYPTTNTNSIQKRICIDRVRTRSASSRSSAGNAIIPISANDRNITIQNAESTAGGSCGFYILAYRRIGTNLSEIGNTKTKTIETVVFNNRNTGTYSLNLTSGRYRILVVGNGGGGGSAQRDSKWFGSSGGSGATWEGELHLDSGTYSIVIGALGSGKNANNTNNVSQGTDSSDTIIRLGSSEILRVGCGKRGTSLSTAANGGTVTLNRTPMRVIKNRSGNKGSILNYGSSTSQQQNLHAASSYDGTKGGYGAGNCSYGNDNKTVTAIKGIVTITKIEEVIL